MVEKIKIAEIKKGDWTNTYWNTEGLYTVEVKNLKRKIEYIVIIDGMEIIEKITGMGYLVMKGLGDEVYIREEREYKKLRTLIAKEKYKTDKRVKTYFVKKSLKDNEIDMRAENITIVTAESYDYDDRLEGFREVAKWRNKKAVEKGVFKKRMNAEYAKKISEKNRIYGAENSILNEQDIKDIRELAKIESQSFVANKYNVGRATIADIVNYRTFNEYLFEHNNLDFFVDKETQELMIKLQDYDEKTHELIFGYSGENLVYVLENGDKYMLRQKVSDQICLFKFNGSGEYLSDAHVRIIKPNHRNSWRNFTIIKMRGNHEAKGYMGRKEIYDVLFSINERNKKK